MVVIKCSTAILRGITRDPSCILPSDTHNTAFEYGFARTFDHAIGDTYMAVGHHQPSNRWVGERGTFQP